MISKTTFGFAHSDLDLMENLLVCDSLRGADSTGLFGVFKNKQAKTLKVAAEPHLLFKCTDWTDFRDKAVASMTTIIGHNRYATKGAVTSSNAHPFHEGSIVLVHNGTLSNHKSFNSEVEVDSHAIAHALNEQDAVEVLSKIDGAFVFIWYDRRTGLTYVARNSQRPLSIIETTDKVILGSEPEMIEWIVNRKNYSAPNHTAKLVPTNKILGFDGRGKIVSEEEFTNYVPKSMGVTYTTPSTYHQYTPTGTVKTISCHGDLAFERGEEILLKITDLISENANGTFRVKGKTVWPVMGEDWTGILDRVCDKDDLKDMMLETVQGTVTAVHTSNCGHAYYINSVEYVETVATLNMALPRAMWNHIVKEEPCAKCGTKLFTEQAGFTSVKIRQNSGKYRVVCASCVQESRKHVKFEDSSDEVQECEPVGKGYTDADYREIEAYSTVH